MTLWLAIAGWALVTALAVQGARLTRRLELVARAEHELRGPVSALALAVEALGRQPELRRRAAALDAHLDRMRLGLADLDAARAGRRAAVRSEDVALEGVTRAVAESWGASADRMGAEISFDWRAGPVVARADRARLSQALGNVLANAVEHGGDRIAVSGERHGDGVRIAVHDEGQPGPRDRDRPRTGSDARPGADRRQAGRARGRGLRIAARALGDMRASLRAPALFEPWSEPSPPGLRMRGDRGLPGSITSATERAVHAASGGPAGTTARGRHDDRTTPGTEVRIELPLVEGSPG